MQRTYGILEWNEEYEQIFKSNVFTYWMLINRRWKKTDMKGKSFEKFVENSD